LGAIPSFAAVGILPHDPSFPHSSSPPASSRACTPPSVHSSWRNIWKEETITQFPRDIPDRSEKLGESLRANAWPKALDPRSRNYLLRIPHSQLSVPLRLPTRRCRRPPLPQSSNQLRRPPLLLFSSCQNRSTASIAVSLFFLEKLNNLVRCLIPLPVAECCWAFISFIIVVCCGLFLIR
jgi:hypothetical protein